MKAIFPNKGIVILTKQDVQKLNNFYKDTLLNSKLYSIYELSDYSMQIENFSYLPKKANIILDNANLLTLKQLHEILKEQIPESQNSTININNFDNDIDDDTPLDDNFILNHPFFKTLKPLN